MLAFARPRSAARFAALSCALTVALASVAAAAAPPPPLDLGGGVRLALIEVPAGTFVQGSAAGDPGHGADEGRREVSISQAFWIARSPVTVGQFRRFAEEAGYVTEAEKGSSGGFGWDGSKLTQRKDFTWRSPGYTQTDEHPAVIITFGDAQAFATWLARRTGLIVSLPTEAQFEWAARGGTKARFFWGDNDKLAEQKAWFAKNAGRGAMPVGSKPANEWGLVDAAGNVWEWCLDFHGPITGAAATDPIVRDPATWEHSDKPRRVLKGGSWLTDDRWKLRAAARNRATEGSRNADFGFRVVAVPGTVRSAPPPAASSPAAPAPTSSSTSGSPPSAGAAVLGCGAMGCVGVLIFGAIFIAIRAATRGRRAGGGIGGAALVPPAVQVRTATDGFWLVASSAAVRAEVTYALRTHSRTTTGRSMVDPGPQGTFVYTGEPPLDVQIVGVKAAGAPAYSAASGSSWRGGQRSSSWSTSDDDHHRHHHSSSSSSSWPSAY